MIPVLENNFFSRGSKYYAVSPCSFVDYTEFYPENPKVNNALFICRIEQHKNPLLLLNSIIVFNRKYKINEEIKFYLMGEGRLSDQVREFIKVNNLFNVEYLGSVINIAPWLRKSKIFFSIQEQTNYPSQSLLEAMACENAIIASDVGETRLLITENEGILVNLNAEKIAGAIYKLFSTPGLVTKLGKNARHKALNEHTIERYAEYIFSLTN
jgi:glycosyltransferase involved in cell wall biosynthesis